MRRTLPLLLLVAGCRQPPQAAAAEGGTRIDCAIGTGHALAATCSVEDAGNHELVVRHPDGGFRRLAIADDGHGIVAADGAEPARVTIVGDHLIEVAIADDRYRLPATLKAQPK